MRSRPIHYLALVLALAAVYFVAAKLGLKMAFVAEQVTVVWPPTGIALAALLLFGHRVWPGVALGAFLANVTANESVGPALGIALGNTLEAVTGAWLLRRFVAFDPSMERLKDVLGLVLLSAAGSTLISASIGAASLCLSGIKPWSVFRTLWWVWWLGDAVGALVVAPVLLTWANPSQRRWQTNRAAEMVVLLSALVCVSLVVFVGFFPWVTIDPSLEYAIFPFVIWAALRLGQRGTTAVTLVVAASTVWGTIHVWGPFTRGAVHESLVLSQTFMAAVAVSGLFLGAAIAERDQAERRRYADQAVTHILAESATLTEATPRLLRTICDSLGWDLGVVWRVDMEARLLRCMEIWHQRAVEVGEFESVTRSLTLGPGVGLPGRVWATGEPAWIADVVRDKNFPRASVAMRQGLHGSFAFPILLGGQVHGVVEFFSHKIRQPEPALLQLFAAVGSQVGQFIERKRAEESLRISEEALRNADQRKDEFLAMLAHELRNPLAPIRNALEIMKMTGANRETVERARQMIERQVKHLTRLVDDLLDVSRIMRGRIDLRKELIELESVVTTAVETVQPMIDALGLQLIVSLPRQRLQLNADPTRLAQVLGNLLHNAAKFSEQSGCIWLSAERQGTEAILRVRDEGAGIRPELLPQVFDLFVQGDRSLERSRGGLGIGLTVVRRLVELHGGTVTASSASPGKGSEFVVRLPGVLETATEAPTEINAQPTETPPFRRVLVVDDNVDAAESIAILLRLWGHEVRLAHNGPEALKAAAEQQPQVVLLDIGLPGMSGFEVAKHLREKPQFESALMVAVTGYGQDADRHHAREAGFDHHLTKPVDPDVLRALIAS